MGMFTEVRKVFGIKTKNERREEARARAVIDELVALSTALIEEVRERTEEIETARTAEARAIQQALSTMEENPGGRGVLVERGFICTQLEVGEECDGTGEHKMSSEVSLDERVPYGKVGYLMPGGDIVDRDTQEVLNA